MDQIEEEFRALAHDFYTQNWDAFLAEVEHMTRGDEDQKRKLIDERASYLSSLN